MRRVLALDDDISILELLKEWGVENGAEVVCVTTNGEAMKLLEESGFDELVVDWNLDPFGRRQGPYTEPVIRVAVERRIPITVRSGTDDSTGRLVLLKKAVEGIVPFRILEKFASIELTGLPPERR